MILYAGGRISLNSSHNQSILYQQFDAIAGFYQKKETAPAVKKAGTAKKRAEKKENAEG